MVQIPLYRPPEYQEHPPEYQEWYRVVQSPLYRPPEYQEHPPEYQEWYRAAQSPLHRPSDSYYASPHSAPLPGPIGTIASRRQRTASSTGTIISIA